MAKAKSTGSVSTIRVKPKIKRKGVHSKTKNSRSAKSKHYKKAYKGQGR